MGGWADRVRGHLARTIEGIVAAGRDLAAAKADLPHGQWLPMLAEAGINERSARMLMGAAENVVLANPCNARVLPAGDYTMLYHLSRLPEAELQAAIDAGEVTVGGSVPSARTGRTAVGCWPVASP